jgi:hypothetical protein
VRLFFRRIDIEPSLAAFAVMLFSMGIDWWRSRVLGRIASKYDSQALEADALHFSTDIWSAGVVVLGLVLVLVGRTYHVEWLRDSDPCRGSVRGRRCRFRQLAPGPPHRRRAARCRPAGRAIQIYDAVLRIDGVLEVDRVRIRRAGNRYFADLAVGLARTVTFQRSGQLAASVTEAVRQSSPRSRRNRAAPAARTTLRKHFRSHSRRGHRRGISTSTTSACRISPAAFTSNSTLNSKNA